MNLKTIIKTIVSAGLISTSTAYATDFNLLNVSYDPTRELYQDINQAFTKSWVSKNPQDKVNIKQSHGGSGKQALGILGGLDADVATLALAYDIDVLNQKGNLLKSDWQKQFQCNSSPYTSTIVFLVRKGNPKNIKNWDDLTKQGISVVTPNPKTSGGARWNYLAAWGYALEQSKGDQKFAQEFVTKLFANVAVLDSGARGATISFTQRNIGDVLLAWENEALLAKKELGPDKFDIVTPSTSILAEPPIAIVDKNVDKKGTRKIATEYLNFLYTAEGQKIISKHHFRPCLQQKYGIVNNEFSKVKLFTVDKVFGGWQKAQKTHFSDGGIFDQVIRTAKAK